MTTHLDDLNRCRAALAGDRDAASALFRDHVDGVLNFVYHRVGGRLEVAEEIVQEAFLDAFRALDTYRGEASLHTWLCGVARTRIAAHFRREARASRRGPTLSTSDPAVEALASYLAGEGPLPEDAVLAEELRGVVDAALSELPVHWARLLCGKYQEGLSASELAERGETTVAAVNSALQRAREAFGVSLRRVTGDPASVFASPGV